MVSDVVQKQVDDIQEQGFKRLREISILVLSLTVAFFISYLANAWFYVDYSAKWEPNADWIYLRYNMFMTVTSFVFLLIIVWFLWWCRNKPQFHVLFTGRKKKQEQINSKRFFMRGLIPVVVIAIGFSVYMIIFDV